MKRYAILLAVLGLCFSCACNRQAPSPQPEDSVVPAAVPENFSEFNNDFAFRLYQKADAEGKNLFFSPYSISTALSMAYGGAKGNTASQMAKALSFGLPEAEHHKAFGSLGASLNELGKRGKAQLNVANGLFQAKVFEKLLLPDYRQLLRDHYDSDIYSLDFQDFKGTADYINKWVLDRTNQRIKDLVSEDHIRDSNDGMVLVNAIFFKGMWKLQFDPKATRRDDFWLRPPREEGNSKPVDMMFRKDLFGYAELPGCQVLELPYEEEDLAMMVVLPDENAKSKPVLNLASYKKWREALKPREVMVYLPRFTLEITLENLPAKLKSMGMIDAFDEVAADFTGIREPGAADLFIMDVIHKAFVEVKEEGTEAAAATAVVMGTKAVAMPDETPVFRADHPFIYMIIHKPSGSVLFMGKMADPPTPK